MIEFSNIPHEMTMLPNWVARKGKRPFGINGKPAKTNTPATWGILQDIRTFLKTARPSFAGIGFVLERKNNIICIDIDHCMTNGVPNETARQILENISTYTEISMSGGGLHLFGYGSIEQSTIKFLSPFDSDTHIEIYAGMDGRGKGGRFIALTADIHENRKELKDISKGLEWLLQYKPNKQNKPKPPAKQQATTAQDNTTSKTDCWAGVPATIKVAGNEYTADDIPRVIEKSLKGSKLEKWNKLFYSADLTQYNNDHSKADMALCGFLCFWCHGNPALIDKVFRRSALMREKWDDKRQGAKTYGELTIEKALKNWNGKKNTGTTSNKPIFTILDSKGNPVKVSYSNFCALLEWLHDVSIRYNQLKHQQEIFIKGVRYDMDMAIVLLQEKCAIYGLSTRVTNIQSWIVAKAEKNAYNPVADYLQECYESYQQDKANNVINNTINKLWNTLHLTEIAQIKEPFFKALFIKWLVGCVAIAHNTGTTSLQGVLVLKGAQGIGKTSFAKKLIPEMGLDWFVEGASINVSDKDSLITATSCWLLELGEFSETFRKSHFDALKNFITKSIDTIRHPYARNAKAEPRLTAYIATVNDDRFLADNTGNRRYWVLDLESIDLDTQINPNQLWGEVMALWKDEKMTHFLTQSELNQLLAINRQFEKETEFEPMLIDSLDWNAKKESWQWLTPTAICKLLDIPATNARKMGRALISLSQKPAFPIERKRTNQSRGYFIPPLLKQDKQSNE